MPASVSPRPMKGRKGSRHDRTGCLTCRQRRKKCIDNVFPICGECARLNLECTREPPRRVVMPQAELIQPPSSPDKADPTARAMMKIENVKPKIGLQLLFTRAELETPNSRSMMKYYMCVLSNLVAASRENNAFLTGTIPFFEKKVFTPHIDYGVVFLPMSADSPAVLEALIAWSSGHLSIFDSTYELPAMEARSKALTTMRKAISTVSTNISDQEANLATALVMATNEIGLGTDPGWSAHLVGAKNIILGAQKSGSGGKMLLGPEAFVDRTDGKWLLRNFAYHDIIWSVTNGKPALIDDNYLEGISTETDSYLGAAFPILKFILDISSLEVPWDETSSIVIQSFWARCAQLETDLKNWTCVSTAMNSMTALAHTYRSAALIHLYRKMRSSDVSPTLESRMQESVASTMYNVHLIPLDEAPVCGLLFPLFMAGGETMDEGFIEAIRMRLHFMVERRGFQNVKLAAQVLERLWALKATKVSVDWMALLKAEGCMLILT